MAFSTAAKNTMLDALAVVQVSLHTADPGALGLNNEVSGGSPAYARKAITYAAATGSARDSSSAPVFDVPATTVSFVGFWTAAGAIFMGSTDVTDEVFAAQGTYTLSDSDLTLSD